MSQFANRQELEKARGLTLVHIRVGSGTSVHAAYQRADGSIAGSWCGAGRCYIGTRRWSNVHKVEHPVTCKKCKAKLDELIAE